MPIYLLQFCYGLSGGFPAILVPQLREPCSEFQIDIHQESWIGENKFTNTVVCLTLVCYSKFGQLDHANCKLDERIDTTVDWTQENACIILPPLYRLLVAERRRR